MQSSKEPDTRIKELTAVNCRLKTLYSFLKTKHTSDSLNRATELAQQGIGNHTPTFVPVDGVTVQATRHFGSLMQLAEILEMRNAVGNPDAIVEECTALLERKVELLSDLGIHGASA